MKPSTSRQPSGPVGLSGRDMISVRDFDLSEILGILDVAQSFEREDRPLLRGRVLATLFFEPSTRTRLSFESAMKRLGGNCLGFADMSVSSTTKGESLEDTIRVVEGYCDIILIRHPVEGAARVAAEATDLPVINGGDGSNQHPTQTLLDLYTIRKGRGKIEGLKVAFLGDLKYGRTVHSLVDVLAKFGNSLVLISPPGLGLPADLLEDLDDSGVSYDVADSLDAISADVDVIYTTRIQKERFADALEYGRVQNTYHLDTAAVARFKDDVTIMHPLPRVTEIDPELDRHPGAAYFQQARNGVVVRKAILCLMLGIQREYAEATDGASC